MSKTVISEIRNNSFAPLHIYEDTYVIWKNLDPYPHSVETLPNASNYFNAGALFPNELSSPVYFPKEARIPYICRFHHDMAGEVIVSKAGTVIPSPSHHGGHHGGGHSHLKHFHGFVTGGRSSKEMFLTHTPVLADMRHCYQVILQASIPDPKQGKVYDDLRKSGYGDGKIQIFHDHLSLPEIGNGTIKLLPECSFEYYPDGGDGAEVPGLSEKIPVRIDKVIHFHTFLTENTYPDGLTYIIYGNAHDVFIDHLINRAPSFHSVSKLVRPPAFYSAARFGTAITFSIPEKRMIDVSPKTLSRVAFVDNSFHMFWLPPTGVYPRAVAQDPLIKRDSTSPVYKAVDETGMNSEIEIKKFLHFDVRLLNYGVLIT